jgi:methionyl-tRNA synthetase
MSSSKTAPGRYADDVAKRFFVTTPIYYVTDPPHLGTAYTTIVADAMARWHRLAGDEVFFLTGVDEHGLKVARAAESQQMEPQAWVDAMSAHFEAAWRALGISNDDFIRTTEPRHTKAVQRFAQAIYDNGFIRKGNYTGWYCVACEAYYAGDELEPGELCPVHGKPVEWLTEENYFFELSRFAQRLIDWYASAPAAVIPESRRNEALGIIRQGLEDISITRTAFDWGIPVPWDEAHVIYVWFDALVNYATAIGYGEDGERFSRWWAAVHHLMAKEIVRFHCVWWPAMCMAAGIDPPLQVIAHGWLLVGGEKMAKSRANQIDPVALAADVGVDALRYHLLRDVVLGLDGDITYEGLIGRYNADLANNLGNLLQRVTTVVQSKCGGLGPAPRPAGAGNRLAGLAAATVEAVRSAWEKMKPHEALEVTWQLIHETNVELERHEPWKLPPGDEVDGVLGDALEVLRIVAILASPAMPQTAQTIWGRLGLEGDAAMPGRASATAGALSWGGYPGGHLVEKAAPLFPRRRNGASPTGGGG